MILVLLGAPGVGKGTQSRKICQHFGVPHLSTGEMLRRESKSGSELGREIARHIDIGHFAPDRVVTQLVGEFLSRNPAGCLLDGFPRSVEQAEQFEEYMAGAGAELTAVIELQVGRAELERRLLERGRIEGRPDDTPAAIAERMRIYEELTRPLVDFYRQRGVLEVVSGVGSPDDVFARVQAVIERRVQGDK